MNEKMRSCVMGLILGQFSSPLPMAQKEPVAYLYNGVELPDINTVYTPELQKTHPYAVLTNGYRAGLYVLYLDDGTPYLATDSSGDVHLRHDGQSHTKVFYDVAKDTEWRDMTGYVNSSSPSINKVFWTSHDILNEDGSVFLAASEPIPVYD